MISDDHEKREKLDLEIVQRAVSTLGEHFDSVQVFVTRLEDEEHGTMNLSYGSGNWFSRYGQVAEWMIRRNEDTRLGQRKD